MTFTVTGKNVNGGAYDISHENITYKTNPEGQIVISPDGKVTVSEGAKPGKVQVWAEVVNEGKTYKTEKVTLRSLSMRNKQFLKKEATGNTLIMDRIKGQHGKNQNLMIAAGKCSSTTRLFSY